jgi:hypothetical protein
MLILITPTRDADTDLIKTATICPPDIYGQSTSIGKTSTFLVPKYVEALLKYKEAFYLGEGNNIRAVTHIDDVVSLFVIMIEQALQGGGTAEWGKEVCKNKLSYRVRRAPANATPGVLLCGLGQRPLERRGKSDQQDRAATRLAPERQQTRFVEEGTSRRVVAGSSRSRAVSLGLEQSCRVCESAETGMEAVWAEFLGVFGGGLSDCEGESCLMLP